jgi:ATP-binding cassette subfamily C (CFTR/MRP) protein 1
LRAPVTTFFDITTSGEITNKFGKDLELTDNQLPENCQAFLGNASLLLSIAILGIYAVPWFAILIVVGVGVVVCVSRVFAPASRDLKRLDGSSRSPIYNCFSETLVGLDTIRAWNLQDQFLDEQLGHMKKNLACYLNACMSETWVQIRLEMVTTLVISSLALIAVSLKESVDAELVGLALVYSIQLTAMMQRTCQLVVMISQFMTACERVLSFASLEQEPELSVKSDRDLPADWPRGSITFNNVQMRYRDGDLVLRGVSFAIEAGQRLGICGRTGAGKSSVLQIFFRVADPCGGSISIDGIDTRSIGLRKLRSSLAIVPQEAVLFSGSLRSNIDPFGFEPSDDVLIEIMERVGLQDLAKSGLTSAVAENGSNLSQGQRQLLCIARIMVQPRRITVLDEATSSMDAETDRAVQRAMTEQWRAASSTGASTQMTIAHRLSTILDYDKILVLAQGQVAEFDTPAALQADRGSVLYSMLHDAGNAHKHDEAGAGIDCGTTNEGLEFGV